MLEYVKYSTGLQYPQYFFLELALTVARRTLVFQYEQYVLYDYHETAAPLY